MPIRFKCPGCKKALQVKDHLAGRKGTCPACKSPVMIPAAVAPPADVDDFAAKAFDDDPAKKAAAEAPGSQNIKFNCEWCDAEVEFPPAEGGKKAPCPECRRILKIPLPKKESTDWRDVRTTGPSGALINQPKELEGAWGNQNKGGVSKEAMEEADAYIYEEEDVTFGTRLKQGFFALCIVGFISFLTVSAIRNKSKELQKESMKHALELARAPGEMPPAWKAAVYRAAGELHLARKQPDQARAQFNNAWTQFFRTPASVDQDLFLMQLALAQVDLGGTRDQVDNKEKLEWQEVRKDLDKTLLAITAPEARLMAMRRLGSQLMARGQGHLAIDLAGELTQAVPQRQRAPFTAQQVAFLLARNETDKAEKLTKPPTKDIPELGTAMAYTEGWIRLGKHKEALDLASALRFPQERLQACLGGAAVILGEASNSDAVSQAVPFLEKALLAYQERRNQEVSPWYVYQLVTLAAQTPLADKLGDVSKNVAGDFKAHLELARVQESLTKTSEWVALNKVEEVTTPKTLPRAWALECLARHNARNGFHEDLTRWANQNPPEPIHAALFAGLALGEHDRRK